MNTILDLIPTTTDARYRPKPPGVTYFLGLDLGQRHDHTAVAVIERAVVLTGEFDLANFQQLTTVELRLRDVARVPLDTPYKEVARKVAEAIARPPFNGNSTLAIDATGVGRPVVDHLKMMRPPCRMVPVVITGPGRSHQSNGTLYLPRQDLIANLQVLLESRALKVAYKSPHAHLLKTELLNFGQKAADHDDLVFASALAAWLANR